MPCCSVFPLLSPFQHRSLEESLEHSGINNLACFHSNIVTMTIRQSKLWPSVSMLGNLNIATFIQLLNLILTQNKKYIILLLDCFLRLYLRTTLKHTLLCFFYIIIGILGQQRHRFNIFTYISSLSQSGTVTDGKRDIKAFSQSLCQKSFTYKQKQKQWAFSFLKE